MADKQRTVSIVIEAKNAADSALKQVGLSLGGLAAAAAAAGAAFAVIAGVIKSAIAAASEQQEADVRLAAGLRAVGQNTREVREDLAAFIDSLQFASRFTDEAIGSVVTALVPFQRLGINVKEATQAILDYAALTGQDAMTATQGLINVVVKGTGRLQGINTKFEEGATAAEKYASTLKQMKAVAEGTAEAMSRTFAGALDQIDKQIETQLEKLGDAIVKNKAIQDALAQTAISINAAGAAVGGGSKELQGLATIIGKVWEAALKAGPTIARVAGSVASVAPGIGPVVSGLRGLWQMLGLVKSETTDVEDKLDPTRKGLAGLGDDATKSASALQQMFDKAGAGVPGFEELSERAESIRKALDALQRQAQANPLIPPEFVQQAHKALADAALELQKFGIFVPGLIVGMDGATESLKRLGIEIPNVAQASEDVAASWQAIQDLAAAGLNPEAVEVMKEQLLAAIEEIRAAGVELESPFTRLQEIMMAVGEAAEGAATQGALQLGDAFVDAAFGARQSWAETIRQILNGIAKAIMKALILKAIEIGFGGGAGAAAGAAAGGLGWNIGGGKIGMQHGGEVRGGIPGLDSIAAMLAPGEIILPRSRAEDFDAIAGLAREIRRGGAGTGLSMQDAAHPGRPLQLFARFDLADDTRVAARLLDKITRLVERNGYRLVASELLT